MKGRLKTSLTGTYLTNAHLLSLLKRTYPAHQVIIFNRIFSTAGINADALYKFSHLTLLDFFFFYYR